MHLSKDYFFSPIGSGKKLHIFGVGSCRVMALCGMGPALVHNPAKIPCAAQKYVCRNCLREWERNRDDHRNQLSG